ncbi:MAG TPA: hypothetical protein PLU93_03105 [Treponemataceae bacterium]|nr:hypothetical protein [Treponemataceae bacterium]
MRLPRRLGAVILALCVAPSAFAQSAAGTSSSAASEGTPLPVPYGPDEFATWQKDLRRAEVIALGSLPFVTFMASIYYDVYRYASHGYQDEYLPWPFKKADIAIDLTEDEQKKILLVSAGISIGVAITDFAIRAIRRNMRARRAERAKPAREPILIEPLEAADAGEGAASGAGAGER